MEYCPARLRREVYIEFELANTASTELLIQRCVAVVPLLAEQQAWPEVVAVVRSLGLNLIQPQGRFGSVRDCCGASMEGGKGEDGDAQHGQSLRISAPNTDRLVIVGGGCRIFLSLLGHPPG